MKAKLNKRETGLVVSASRDKTITVLIERKVKHPLYRKIIKRSTRLQVHDEGNKCKEGDSVIVEECKKISKTKSWSLVEVNNS
tara:strand:+ start:564 stop:812 length:249 start_codon:yes stop_codon:yes gene_type:complete